MFEYFVALIIVTIITFILGLAFNLFFVYGPFQTISRKFNDEIRQGIQVLENSVGVADNVKETSRTASEFLNAFCQGVDNNDGALFNLINDKGAYIEECKIIEECSLINI